MKKPLINFFLLLFVSTVFSACDKAYIDADDFGIFSSQNEETVIIDGVIDSDIPVY